MTDDEAKINSGNRIGDPIASVDFCSVPSCYPSVHFVSLWGAILVPQRVCSQENAEVMQYHFEEQNRGLLFLHCSIALKPGFSVDV